MVVPKGFINPISIISGKRFRAIDASTGDIDDVLGREQFYVDDPMAATMANGSYNMMVSVASDKFVVDDTVLLTDPPDPFGAGTTYYVVTVTSTYIRLSYEKGGSPIQATSTSNTINIYKGMDSIVNCDIRPYPQDETPSVRTGVFYAACVSGANDTTSVDFRTDPEEITKPAVDSNYQRLSIFIYNRLPADGAGMLINKTRSTADGVHLFYTELSFTNNLNAIGVARFVIINPGDATAAELDLLLAGSALYNQKDNLVAIIQGTSVVWSGKIVKSEQDKTSLFTDPNYQAFEITCESDIVRMRTQQTVPANRGEKTFQKIGQIVTALVENDSANDVNWNGGAFTGDKRYGIRSNEGIYLNFTITESDMFTQFMILSRLLDFDWRTTLHYARYSYSRSSYTYTVDGTYGTDTFNAMWVIYVCADGTTRWGTITDTTTTTIVATSSSTPASTGTLIVLMDPVLDIAGDLGTPDPLQTFRMNAAEYTGANGYSFNDRTDRSILATKVTAKGKTYAGEPLTTSIAAVSKWNHNYQCYEYAAYIARKTDARIIHVVGDPPLGTVGIWVEGWGYNLGHGEYYATILTDGNYLCPRTYYNPIDPEEVYYNGQRATYFGVVGLFNTFLNPNDRVTGALICFIHPDDLGSETYGSYLHPYQRYYVDVPCLLSAGTGQQYLIDGEIIEIEGAGVETTLGLGTYVYFLCDNTEYHRYFYADNLNPHPEGTILFMADYYDEADPVTGSPVYYHGIITQTYLVDTSATSSSLQKYATAALLAHSNYLRKAEFWCVFNNWYKSDGRYENELFAAAPILVGDSIACLQDEDATIEDELYGQLQNIWQVISWSFDNKDMIVRVKLGDFERNLFMTITDKTSALHLTVG